MLRIKGETKVEYFDVACEVCDKSVRLSNLRMVGGVPQVEAACESCGETGDFKLHVKSWLDIVLPE